MVESQIQAAGAAQQKAARKNPGKKKAVAKAVVSKAAPGRQVAVHQPAPPPAPTSMLQVISQAVMDPRCDVEKMKALLDMQERIEERDSKKSFTVAFNALQAELPIINRDGKIDHSAEGTSGTTKSGRKALQTKYATYPNLNRVVGPLLKKHGFTFSSSMEPDPSGAMVVVSTLEHVAGHSRTTHFRITADATGGKNNQQGWGSSQQYGMRYNMIALLNIVTEAKEDADNDGFPKDGPITPDQLSTLVKLADEAGANKAKFCIVMGVESFADIPQSRFTEAKQQLERKLKRKQASDFPGDR
jgi:hypothetical protein